MKFKIPVNTKAFLILLSPLACLAQSVGQSGQTPAPITPAPPAPTAPEVQSIEIQGTRFDARREDTASKTVIGREEILRFGDTNLNDVLKRLPGITIVNGGIRLRGLGNGFTQILLNGEPAPPGFEIDSLPSESIEKIEIVRSAVAEFSARGVAGTINIVTKKTIRAGQRELKYSYSNNQGEPLNVLTFAPSDKIGIFSYTLTGRIGGGEFNNNSRSMMQGTDALGIPNFNTQMRQGNASQFKFITLNPLLNFQLGEEDTLISQTFFRYNQNRINNFEVTDFLIGRPQSNPNSTDTADILSIWFDTNLNLIRQLADEAQLDVKLGINYTQRDSNTFFFGSDRNNLPSLDRKNTLISTDTGLSFNGKYTAPVGKVHMSSFGLEAEFDRRRDRREQIDRLPNGTEVSQFMPINLNQRFNIHTTRLAFFGQDEWSLSKQFSLYLGVRVETIKTTSEGNHQPGSSNTSRVLSPILQTLYKLPDSPNTQLRFAFARTYKAPSIADLNARQVLSTSNSATRPDTQGNPELRPELASGLDVTLERFLADGGLLSANSYVRRVKHVTGRGLFNINGRFVTMPINEGEALSRGIELEAKFPLRLFISTAPAIDLRFNVVRNWSRVSTIPGPDNRLDGQTPFSGNLGVDYLMADFPITLGGNFGFQNGGNLRISATETRFSSVKRTLDMFGLWKIDKKSQLRLSLSDLLHQDDLEGNAFSDATGSLNQSTVSDNGTTVRLAFETKF